MLVRKHFQPFCVYGFFEGFVLRPHDDLNDVLCRTTGGCHDPTDIFEHQLALAFDIGWGPSRLGFHSEYSAAPHERTNRASHRDRVLMTESRDFKAATFAHNKFSLRKRMHMRRLSPARCPRG